MRPLQYTGRIEVAQIQRDIDAAMRNKSTERPLIYISGPMRGSPTDTGPWENIRKGMHAAKLAYLAGWLPLCPMLNAFWETATGVLDATADDGASGWLTYDFAWVANCYALARLPGASVGADREVEVAANLGKVVIYPRHDASNYILSFPPAADYITVKNDPPLSRQTRFDF